MRSWFPFRLPALSAILAGGGGASAQEGSDWSDVGPLLAERCVVCHSGEEAPFGLRLDSYEAAVEGSRNGPVLVPGDPSGSELIQRVRGISQPSMPFVGQALNADEIAVIDGWINAGLPGDEEPADEPPPDEPAAVSVPGPDDPVTFAHVEPIFLQRCVVCHSDARPEVSFAVRPGETVALVGASGTGKSTLCALVPRFRDVTEGLVLVDGRDVRDLTLASLRRAVGVVSQDVYLFAGSVAENIRYGRLDATDVEVEEAARSAGAHDFIEALPQGYATEVGQRGVRLSGGQRQRITIARAFLKDPTILILDEATSALDAAASERIVQEALSRLARGRTTLVIAYRLSTVRNADRILVLTDDGIAEEGTHDALIAQGGAYAALYRVRASPQIIRGPRHPWSPQALTKLLALPGNPGMSTGRGAVVRTQPSTCRLTGNW